MAKLKELQDEVVQSKTVGMYVDEETVIPVKENKIKKVLNKGLDNVDGLIDNHLGRKANDAIYIRDSESKGLKRIVAMGDAAEVVGNVITVSKAVNIPAIKQGATKLGSGVAKVGKKFLSIIKK